MAEPYEMSITSALLALEAARGLLLREISDYPGPISGCDAQFNRLLSDKARISGALLALKSEPFVPTPRMLEPRGTIRHL